MENHLQTVLFFCRHGETDYAYSTDQAKDGERVLTEFGQKQIKAVGEYLRSFAPSAIYSSPRKRTLQTAEIIREAAEIKNEIVEKTELFEVYSDADYAALSTKIPELCHEIVEQHAGEHVVLVSHQDVIQGGLTALGIETDEAEFPCRVADCYRVVFVGDTFVQATKLTPAENL